MVIRKIKKKRYQIFQITKNLSLLSSKQKFVILTYLSTGSFGSCGMMNELFYIQNDFIYLLLLNFVKTERRMVKR